MIKITVSFVFVSILLGIVLTQISIASQFEKSSNDSFIHYKQGNILYVGGSGAENYSKIQDAINNASEGDIIYVFQGIYLETISVDKQLYIKGEKKESTIIDAQKKGYTINISADGVNITGFTVQNGSYSSNLINEANLFIFSHDNIIEGNIFRFSESGIIIDNTDRNIVSGNIFYNNTIGLWISGSKNIIIKNLITQNSQMGINIFGSENLISGNLIVNNKETGLYFIDSSKNNITNNEISNNSLGIVFTWHRENYQNTDNLISRNNFRNNTNGNAIFIEQKGLSGRNIWLNNYWNKPRIFPKLIIGLKQTCFYYPLPQGTFWFFIPWFRFDWQPVKIPYDISL